ncbi:MAG: hypothetical protein SVY53_02050 [Chloroflexota bacterium]|nr:hypothetical protein [Chloroflexota bacterium]
MKAQDDSEPDISGAFSYSNMRHHNASRDNKWYRTLGIGLVVAGIGLSLVSFFIIEAVALVALGLSMTILGTISLVLNRTCPDTPQGVALILMETGLDNTASLIEELGLTSRAIYLPSSRAGGKPQALIPLDLNGTTPSIDAPLPRRLIVKYGNAPEDMGLLVSTPGSAAINMFKSKPPCTAVGVESALSFLLVAAIDAAGGVKVFDNNGSLTIEISGPRVPQRNSRLQDCLGSPLASIAATTTSEALDRPVMIKEERLSKGKLQIDLEVLGENV